MTELALFAGSAAAAIFATSQLPMLIKAGRTKNLASYSLVNIVLGNVAVCSTRSMCSVCRPARSGPFTPSTSPPRR